MDRQSWMLFFCILTATLLINHHFSPERSVESRELWKKDVQIHLLEKKENAKLTLEDLSIFPCTLEDKSSLFGVSRGGNFLVLANRASMPKQVEFAGKKASIAFPNEGKEPVIYRTNQEKFPVKELYLSEGQTFYIAAESDTKSAPDIVLGTLQKQEIITSHRVRKDSFAFYENGDLIGIYEAKSQKLRPFQDYFRLAREVSISEVIDETYYVLENPYQMLVFSSKGGALAEINLPFRTQENEKSVVKKISFDRILRENHPQNTQFPEKSYFALKEKNVIKKEPTLGGYYPLLRRNIHLPSGEIKKRLDPKYYCCALVEGEEDPGVFKVTRFEKNLIEFQSTGARRKITKRFSLPKNPDSLPYTFFLTVEVEGALEGLHLHSGVPEVELISGYFSPALKYLIRRNNQPQVNQISLPKIGIKEEDVATNGFSPEWIVNSNGFLGVLLDPINYKANSLQAKAISGETAPTKLSVIDASYGLYPEKTYPGYAMFLPFPKKNKADLRVFAGPFETDTLQRVDQTVEETEGKSPEYTSAQSAHGWFSFISIPFSKFLFLLLRFFHYLTGSWGFSIILLTIAMRILLYPFTIWSTKSMQRMKAMQPKIKQLQEKYKNQPEKLQIEKIKLFKEMGANPFSGCFPIFIQIPFSVGLFDLLKSSFDLRGASFIPGWIDNLAAPDILFRWNYPIFYIGTSFHLLPFIFAFVTIANQKLTAKMTGADSEPMTEEERQQKAVLNLSFIFFAFLFYHLPSALNIYWILSTCLGTLQQYILQRNVAPDQTPPKAN